MVSSLQLLRWVRASGPLAPAALFGLLAAHGLLLPVPATALTVLAGAAFGPVAGLAVSWVGNVVGAVLAWGVARRFGPGLRARLPAAWRARLAAAAHGRAFTVVLAARLLPWLPLAPVSWACGAMDVPLAPYLAATALGVLPETAVLAWFGSSAGLGLLGAAAAAVLVWWLWRCLRPAVG